jgi:S1-C subfamily serine protease
MHARPGRRGWAILSLAALLAALAPSSSPLAEVPSADPAAARRTPVVEIFERWSGSVVFVTGPMFKVRNPSLEEFFKLPGEPSPESSVGSGFVVHESGYVVVNAHAAEKVIYPQVSLSDGRTYRAELVASVHERTWRW